MFLVLDESGDLGWKLDLPNRNGGSSRFFTISHFCCEKAKSHLIERFLKDVHKELNLNPKIEKKGCSFNEKDSVKIANRLIRFLNKNPEIRFGSITVNKQKVQDHLRTHENILYNYVAYQLLKDLISNFKHLHFVPDKRSIRVKNANSMVEYFLTELKFKKNSQIEINFEPTVSTNYSKLWIADWIANFVWRHYEDQRSDAFNILMESSQFFNKELYF